MRRALPHLSGLAAVALLLFLPACSSSTHLGHSESAPSSSGASPLTFPDLALAVHITFQPATPRILQENELLIALPPEQAEKWKNASVTVTASMPGMDHGNQQVTAEYREPGQFVATIVPTMVGDWQADITFASEGKTATASYPFTAEP